MKSQHFGRICTSVFLALVIFFLMWQVPKTLELNAITRYGGYFPYIWCAMGLYAIAAARLYRKPMALLLLGALGWMTAVSVLRGVLHPASVSLYPCVYAFLVCFPSGLLAGRQGLKRFLRIMAALWTLWMTSLAAAGLYASFAGVHLHQTQTARFIGINAGDWRLYLMDYCTNSAGYLMATILTAGAALCCERKAWARGLYAAAIAIMIAALSLTDARTSFVGLSAGAGLTCGVVLFHMQRRRPMALRVAGALLCCVLVLMGGYLALTACTNVLGSLVPAAQRSLLPTALAEDGVVAHRNMTGNLLTYRDDAWRGLFALLREQPQLLLTGVGSVQPMDHVNPYVVSEWGQFDHMHCIYLQILLEYGLPGLMLTLAFLALFAVKAWRVMFTGQRSTWVRLLPVPALALLLCELVECLTIAHINAPAMALLFLSIGFTLAADDLNIA